MNKKFSKYINLDIFEDLKGLEDASNSPFHPELSLAFLVSRVTEPNRKVPWDFIADYLEEVALIYRKLHEQKILSFAEFNRRVEEFENQKLIS